jgi:hypothetical protein
MSKLNDCGVVFEAERHTYKLGNLELVGITGIIKSQLFPGMYSCVSNLVLEKAAQRGKDTHDAFAAFDLIGTVEPFFESDLKQYSDLLNKHGFTVIDSEYLVTDFSHFATAIDKVLTDNDGNIFLADIKTTYSLDKNYLSWQLSICKYLFELTNPELKVSGLVGVHVKDGVAFHKIEEKPMEWVMELLDCQIKGLPYSDPELTVVSDSRTLQLIEDITLMESEIKRLNVLKNDLKEKIQEAFNSHGVERWKNEWFVISKRKAYERILVDSDKLKKLNFDLYEECKKITQIGESINIKLK